MNLITNNTFTQHSVRRKINTAFGIQNDYKNISTVYITDVFILFIYFTNEFVRHFSHNIDQLFCFEFLVPPEFQHAKCM